ncbi:MAG: DUF1080 domain-containing protein [Planctomycetes bacterium]|nr:DUF1080 domain-containing protein [Planctomycetota bacterium]
MAPRLSLAFLGMFCAFPFAAYAGEFKLEAGFMRLDNGKDLEDWTGNLYGWSVIDGVIHLEVEKAKSKNCIIHLQFRATKGADSGVFIHGNQLQVRDYPAGPKQYANPPDRPAP